MILRGGIMSDELFKSLQGTMATIDPMSIKREHITEYRLDKVEEQLAQISKRLDDLIFALKIEFYERP